MPKRKNYAPPRAAISVRQVRYVDTQGRTYVLPRGNDPVYQKHVRAGDVDEGNVERDLRRGLAFDATAEIKELTARVFMYVQLPTPTQRKNVLAKQDTFRITPDAVFLPTPSDRAGGKELLLRQEETGELYRATVTASVPQSRRAKRGFVTLQNVRRVNN